MNIGLIDVSSDVVMATKESGSYQEYLTSQLSHFKKLTSYSSVNLVYFLLYANFTFKGYFSNVSLLHI